MKQYIVLASLIALGVFIYGLIAGPGEGSVAQASGDILKAGAEGMLGE
ncbi:MAG: hypothetical protein LBC58_07280 [Clostridiales Family XIII bacterium]|jgi:hypothetical protein|nr:hypothetical protein [Clostridiales Family XIII bacterium]